MKAKSIEIFLSISVKLSQDDVHICMKTASLDLECDPRGIVDHVQKSRIMQFIVCMIVYTAKEREEDSSRAHVLIIKKIPLAFSPATSQFQSCWSHSQSLS